MLSPSQLDLLDLLVTRRALRFGDFTLKSGRRSPYFINCGSFDRAGDLRRLGLAYAEAIDAMLGEDFACVFGPAYKGIPLGIAAAQGCADLQRREIRWSFDRKEAKEHGDRGTFVGADPSASGGIVIVDDVLTAGTAIRTSLARLVDAGAEVKGIVVAFDRCEIGPDGGPARRELESDSGVPVVAILDIASVAAHMTSLPVAERPCSKEELAALQAAVEN